MHFYLFLKSDLLFGFIFFSLIISLFHFNSICCVSFCISRFLVFIHCLDSRSFDYSLISAIYWISRCQCCVQLGSSSLFMSCQFRRETCVIESLISAVLFCLKQDIDAAEIYTADIKVSIQFCTML